ncbi:MAG: glycine cleavage T C-terminal barrel domain-containing protein, partial [Acidiferrobacterales bacterium]
DVTHDEAIFHNSECVGYVTSGGFAHYVQKSVALGYIPTELAKDGEAFEIELLGEMKPAKIVAAPLYDPAGERMRS